MVASIVRVLTCITGICNYRPGENSKVCETDNEFRPHFVWLSKLRRADSAGWHVAMQMRLSVYRSSLEVVPSLWKRTKDGTMSELWMHEIDIKVG